MANPQPTDAHLRMAHSIGEQLMVSHFTEQQRRILDLILRLSWGCGKKQAKIPHQRDFEVVGVRESHVRAHLDWLVESKVILRDINTYSFNKDFDQWRVSRALAYTPQRLTELVSLNLNHNKPKLTENENTSLRNRETTVYGKRKVTTPDSGSAKERLKKRLKKDIYNIPDWIDKDTWTAFLEMRRKKRAIPTEKAKELLVKELAKLRADGYDPKEVLNQSIMRNYTGVFPLKEGQNGKSGRHSQARRLPSKYREPEEIYPETR